MNDNSTETGVITDLPQEIRSVRVEVVKGVDAGMYLHGASERVVIGTDASVDMKLTDPMVSRFHVELVIEGDAVSIRDLDSRNGTMLDGVELQLGRIHAPTIITIGRTDLRIDLLGERVSIALAGQERFGALVGTSRAMREAFSRLHDAASRGCNLLIEGERGVGKDVAAAAVHDATGRGDAPIELVDCTMPVREVEKALFGDAGRSGALQRCSEGTLVLDEVAALTRVTQRRLRTALQQAPELRTIALSRGSVRAGVNAESFLPELYEVLAPARVRLPPLREHLEDIPLLVSTFLENMHATGTQVATELLAPESIAQLRQSPWPGNVSELRTHVEQLVTAGTTSPSSLDDGPPLVDGSALMRVARRRWTGYFERRYLLELLERTHGNVSTAATLAGVERVYLHRLITKHGLRDVLMRSRGLVGGGD
jgi:two-component system, NtrC family, response regulator GlrR